MSPQSLVACVGCSAERAKTYAEPITGAMERWGIDTPTRQAAFLGQIAVESQRLEKVEEDLFYSAQRLVAVWPSRFPSLAAAAPYSRNPQALANRVYGGCMGNELPGDGWAYHGRGLIQLTGKTAYAAYTLTADVDALTSPELLTMPQHAADSAGWFWSSNALNTIADRRDWTTLSTRINGGKTALSERISAISRALRVLTAV